MFIYNQEEFENKYLHKLIRIKGDVYPTLKNRTGWCTAALIEYEEGPLIAIFFEIGEWDTFILQNDLSDESEFEVIDSPTPNHFVNKR